MERRLTKLKFTRSNLDHGLFNKNGIWILLYVDDLLIAAKRRENVDAVKQLIFREFDGKDLGPVNYFLRVKITRNRQNRAIYLSQKSYVKKLLTEYGIDGCNTATKTPLSKSMYDTLRPAGEGFQVSSADRKAYQRMVGYLMYAATQTRIDIAFDISTLARYMSSPPDAAQAAIKHMLRYIRRTKDLAIKIEFGSSTRELGLEIHYDSSFGVDKTTRRSHAGWVATAGGGPIAWHSALQKIVATSTYEAEYMELTVAAQYTSWLRQILKDFGYKGKDGLPIVIREDNNAAILLLKNLEFHKRTKHIDVKFHYCREEQENGRIAVKYVPTQDNVADGLTKPRDAIKQEQFVQQLHLVKQ